MLKIAIFPITLMQDIYMVSFQLSVIGMMQKRNLINEH